MNVEPKCVFMKAMTPDFVIDAPIVHIDASIVYSDTTPILGFWVTNFNKIFTMHDHLFGVHN